MRKTSKKIFISYAHTDAEYFEIFSDGLKNHLFTSNKYDFGAWEDSKIYLGSFWDEAIQRNLSESDIAILCVSANFLNSKYIEAKEFGVLIAKFPNTLIIPIYFNHCNINAWDELSKKQFFKPVGEKYDKGTKDDFAFCDLVKFRETDSKPIPNSNIELYFKDFVKRLEEELEGKDKFTSTNLGEENEKSKQSLSLTPKVTNNFTGRVQELKQFDEKFNLGNILCIEGLGGIGKTEFTAKYVERISGQRIVWFESKTDSTFESLIEVVGYKDLLRIENNPELATFLGFGELLERDEKVVIIDNFHDLMDYRFISFLKFLKNSLRRCKFILLSRIRLYIEDIDVFSFLLGGLAEDSLEFAKKVIARNYFKSVSISDEKLLKICSDLNGHPFAIQLAIQLLSYEETDNDILEIIKGYKGEKERLSNRLLDEVFNHHKSTNEEKELLLSISVYRSHFDSLSMKYSFGNNYREPLRNLIDKLLVEKRESFYAIHPLAREFAYEKLIGKEEAHQKAVNYYLQTQELNDLFYYEELFYHLEKANKISTFVSLIEDKGEEIYNRGYTKLLESKINLLLSKGSESLILYNLLTDLSCILNSTIDETIAYAQKAISVKSDNMNAILEAKIALNEALFRKRILDNPLTAFNQLLKECEENNFEKGECICLSYVGQLMIDKGKVIEGEKKMKFSYQKSYQINYVGGIRHCLLKLSQYYLDNNRNKEANECYVKLFEYFDKLGNARMTYIAQNGAAVILSKTGKAKDALKIFEEALIFYKNTGDKKNEAVALFNIGTTLKRIDDDSDYLSYIYKSLKIDEELKDYERIGNSLKYIADIDFEKNSYLAALKNYLSCFLNLKKTNIQFDTRFFCLKIKNKVGINEYDKLYSETCNGFEQSEREILNNENLAFKPVNALKKNDRNDIVKVIYKDGSIVVKKFKKVEGDISLGNCSIIE